MDLVAGAAVNDGGDALIQLGHGQFIVLSAVDGSAVIGLDGIIGLDLGVQIHAHQVVLAGAGVVAVHIIARIGAVDELGGGYLDQADEAAHQILEQTVGHAGSDDDLTGGGGGLVDGDGQGLADDLAVGAVAPGDAGHLNRVLTGGSHADDDVVEAVNGDGGRGSGGIGGEVGGDGDVAVLHGIELVLNLRPVVIGGDAGVAGGVSQGEAGAHDLVSGDQLADLPLLLLGVGGQVVQEDAVSIDAGAVAELVGRGGVGDVVAQGQVLGGRGGVLLGDLAHHGAQGDDHVNLLVAAVGDQQVGADGAGVVSAVGGGAGAHLAETVTEVGLGLVKIHGEAGGLGGAAQQGLRGIVLGAVLGQLGVLSVHRLDPGGLVDQGVGRVAGGERVPVIPHRGLVAEQIQAGLVVELHGALVRVLIAASASAAAGGIDADVAGFR